MTQQLPDMLKYQDEECVICSWPIPEPKELSPIFDALKNISNWCMYSTTLQKGYRLIYLYENDQLYLEHVGTSLKIEVLPNINGICPSSNGISCGIMGCTSAYKNLKLPINTNCQIVIKKVIRDPTVPLDQEPEESEAVCFLNFENGHLVKETSTLIRDLVDKNYPPYFFCSSTKVL